MNDTPPSTSEATNITWHAGSVTPDQRRAALGQSGATVWFTGLSGSGKSTVAVEVERQLVARGRHAYRLDGDNVRMGLCSNLGFAAEDRDENIRRIGEVAKLFADSGLICLCSFVSPYRAARAQVRALHESAAPPLPFLEVHVDVSIEVAAQRDPKGLYAKALAGKIKNFTGVSAPFEAPQSPELHLPTDDMTVPEAATLVVNMLENRGLLTP
ncbi:MAG: adenylyl-sulfate kinase [Algisphaera sp.]